MELPLLEVPSIYRGNFGSKEYAVFVEASDANELKGHYLALDKEISDSIAFRLSFDGKTCALFRKNKYLSESEQVAFGFSDN